MWRLPGPEDYFLGVKKPFLFAGLYEKRAVFFVLLSLLWGGGAAGWFILLFGIIPSYNHSPVIVAAQNSDSVETYSTRYDTSVLSETPVDSGGLPESEGRCNEGRIPINAASAEQLQELHGIGPAISARIVEYREQNGPFRDYEQILEVRGIGPVKLDIIKDGICL